METFLRLSAKENDKTTHDETNTQKKEIYLREWSPSEIELSPLEIEQLYSVCLQKSGLFISESLY
jgi:hypothetical protein